MVDTIKKGLRRAVLLSGWMMAAGCAGDAVGPNATAARVAKGSNEGQAAITQADMASAIDAIKTYLSTTVLARSTELAASITVQQTIGSQGGTISIPATGFELVVPKGAVSKNTVFTVTALAGKSIAYEFGPHGMTFKKPLIFRQNSMYTTGWWNATSGGYFKSTDQVDTQGGKAKVDETMPMVWDGFWMTLQINHFSGYLVSCA